MVFNNWRPGLDFFFGMFIDGFFWLLYGFFVLGEDEARKGEGKIRCFGRKRGCLQNALNIQTASWFDINFA